MEFEFLESEKIVATDAFEMILRAIDDKEFFNFVENYRNNGFIDCEKEQVKLIRILLSITHIQRHRNK